MKNQWHLGKTRSITLRYKTLCPMASLAFTMPWGHFFAYLYLSFGVYIWLKAVLKSLFNFPLSLRFLSQKRYRIGVKSWSISLTILPWYWATLSYHLYHIYMYLFILAWFLLALGRASNKLPLKACCFVLGHLHWLSPLQDIGRLNPTTLREVPTQLGK